MPTPSWTAARYRRRDTPEYAHQPLGALRKQWQPDVYLAARRKAAASVTAAGERCRAGPRPVGDDPR